MTLVFILSLITFSIIFAALLWHRICLAALSEQVEQLRIQQGQL